VLIDQTSVGYLAGSEIDGESTVAGHGPGVVTLLSGPQSALSVRADTTANVARVLNIRRLSAPRAALPLAARERRWRVASTARQAVSSR
jgi:hypothetical protein